MPVLTAYENVELPLLLTRLAASERREHVEAALAMPEFREWATSVSDLVLFDLGNERA